MAPGRINLMSRQTVTHNRPNEQPVRYELLSVPLYMVGEVSRLIAGIG